MNRPSRATLVSTVLAVFFLLVVGAPSASANISTYSLNVTSGTVCGSPPCLPNPGLPNVPWATATITLVDSKDATIAFVATSGFLFYDHNQVAVNVNAAQFQASSITHSSPAGVNETALGFETSLVPGSGVATFTSNSTPPPQEFADDHLGAFNLIVINDPGTTALELSQFATRIAFTVHDITGTWASAANVLTADANSIPAPNFRDGNTNYYSAGAHIYSASNKNGYVANSDGPVTVPEADTPVLFGMFASCVGIICLIRSRRRRSA